MAGIPHGLVDMKTIGSAGGSEKGWEEVYTGIIRFLTSSQGASIGATRVAYSTGSSSTANLKAVGTANNYWDTGNSSGNNAWSVFKFVSSSLPWYMLVQWVGADSIAVPGSPGNISGQSGQQGIGFAFAVRLDSGNPWGGTSNNSGADTKGTQVWNSGSSQLFVWPRNNSFGGTYVAQKQQMMGPFGTHAASTFYHVIADNDNFAFVFDDSGNSSHTMVYFGKYSARSGTTPNVPYVALYNDVETYDPFIQLAAYGTVGGKDGGVASNDSNSGTLRVTFSGVNEFWTTSFQPNNNFGAAPVYDEFPVHLGSDEGTSAGYLGTLDYGFIRYIYNCASNDISSDFSRAIFGNASTASCKVSLPWTGLSSPPGSNINRSGTYF